MRVLATGSNSLLGKALWEQTPKGISLLLTYLPPCKPRQNLWQTKALDVTDNDNVMAVVSRFRPQWILHLAALSDVDYCEKHKKQAYLVNVQGTKNIIKAGKTCGSHFLFTSTNGIFDGKHAPYKENSLPHPLHVYGKTKLEAEQLIRQATIPSLIVRLITMYSWSPEGTRQNPVTWALKQLKKGITLDMVTDSFVNPLYAPSAAEAIWKLIKADASGIFHIAGKTRVSRYNWTIETAKIFGFNPSLVKPVKSNFFPSFTPRPRDTSFSTKKIEHTINWKPLTLKQGLIKMRKEKKES